MIILAIETSCDETAVAIVEFKEKKVRVLSNIISSQVKVHSKYGGVVPSLASRMHLKNIVPVLSRALRFAKISKSKINCIAVTNGPGLIPALMVGVSAAKTLSYALNKPLIGVHHVEGHIYANWLMELKAHKVHKVESYDLWEPEFPILCLIVSGGHTQLILMKKDLNYKVIGETLDDAAGEAFDKVAKLLNLGYPGGPLIEKIAKKGDKNKYKFTRPMINSDDYNFSFSGLKTAVLYEARKFYPVLAEDSGGFSHRGGEWLKQLNRPLKRRRITNNFKQDMAASFQQVVIDVLISKTIKAVKEYKVKNILLGGGVAANKELQRQFRKSLNEKIPNSKFQIPNSNLSTDNALMIAVAAYYRIVNNKGVGNWKSVKADANLKL
jgi:N6-L-threonylcarbamoyladenine synthase